MIDAAELRRLVEQWQLALARRPAFGIDGDKKAEAFYQTTEQQLLHFVTSHASELLALVEAEGWRTIDDAPSEGKVWVFGGRHSKPALVLADGEHWRHMRDHRLSMTGPTHWHPLYIPPPPEPAQ